MNWPGDFQNKLILGDCQAILPYIPMNSIDSVVTDPPYGLNFMGQGWDNGVPGAEFWTEILRVLKPGGHLVSFGGTRTFHRLTSVIEDSGFEIRDCLMWLYGQGFPKSHNIAKADSKAVDWDGWGTALKPGWEPIILARKPIEGTVVENILKYNTGGLNIDACRVSGEPSPSVKRRKNAAPKESIGSTGWVTPARPESYNEQRAGEQLGRWPANLILDEESGLELDKQSGNRPGCTRPSKAKPLSKFRPNQGNYAAQGPIYPDNGGASRFFYCAKASKHDRGKNNTHPTVKPVLLMQWLCRLITPPNGIILDPFCGSGSTLKAAELENFKWIGIDKEEEYINIAKLRLEVE